MSPNIKLNGYLSILIFGYVIILHSYLGHFCLLLEMILIFPEEIKKLEEIYSPYMINCKLKEDAPQEAIDAFEKEGEWIHEQYRLAGME